MSIKKNVQDILIPSEERHIRMYPMDFEEFLLALGNDTLMGIIKKCFTENKSMGQSMHRKAMDYFRQYLIVGGMPQAVQEYVLSKDFDKVAWGDPMCGYPNVIARCKPEDKLNILKKFKDHGTVMAEQAKDERIEM